MEEDGVHSDSQRLPGLMHGSSGIPVPSTPAISRIPQPQFVKTTNQPAAINNGQLSPLSKHRAVPLSFASGGEALTEMRPEISNIMQPPSTVMRRSTSTRSGPGISYSNYGLNTSRKPLNENVTEKRSSSAIGMAPKKLSSIPATTTTTGKPSIRPKSANAIRRHPSNSSSSNVSISSLGLRSGPEDDQLVGSGRILSGSVGSNAGTKPWDVKGRLEMMESRYEELYNKLNSRSEISKDEMDDLKEKVAQLETERAGSDLQQRKLEDLASSLQNKVRDLNSELDDERRRSRIAREDMERSLSLKLEEERRQSRHREDDISRHHQVELESVRMDVRTEYIQRESQFLGEIQNLKRQIDEERLNSERTTRDAESRARAEFEAQTINLHAEINRLRNSLEEEKVRSEVSVSQIKETLRATETQLKNIQEELARERSINATLRDTVAEQSASTVSIQATSQSLQFRIQMLETELQNKDDIITNMKNSLDNAMESEMNAKEKLQKEETLRRILHNQVQELKGNIRVFCRIRPPGDSEKVDQATINFPDIATEGREIEIIGPSNESALGTAMGTVTTKPYPFAFDKVFPPESTNGEVFSEISQLIQSALDGYNVCIFCYGQTGSGKTYTMSSSDGIIPRAVDQIFTTAMNLNERGWKYTILGEFLEIYNENINDLLVDSDEFEKKKLDIRNDTKEGKMTVPDLTQVILDSRESLTAMLRRAMKNRSVAATKANERSSRSHSVFILTLNGVNPVTGEKSQGTLNLIDLAGSERLSQSQSTGDRLKETVAINKSLSCLRDVISALGSSKDGAHIPYRNSKLTYLLQYSLGGNSKTLMFVNISPLKQHISETVNSLRFATKVNSTHIGTARKK
ncbi:P-loop containing nucleoside triphosphate hydrolase protein [Dipodascopsis uninucleata]